MVGRTEEKKLLQSLLKEDEFLKANKYDENYWKSVSNSGEVNAWSGVAFERECLEHIRVWGNGCGIRASIQHLQYR